MKKKRWIPLRTCVVTREQFPKNELLRVVRDNEGNVTVDETGKANGRGAYLKKDLEVLEKAIKSKVLEKHLECEIEESLYDKIKEIIEKWGVFYEYKRLCSRCK